MCHMGGKKEEERKLKINWKESTQTMCERNPMNLNPNTHMLIEREQGWGWGTVHK